MLHPPYMKIVSVWIEHFFKFLSSQTHGVQMSRKLNCFFILLFLTALLCLKGCQPFPGRGIEKDGKKYGVTRSIFKGKWWHYYERALSFAEGEFWKEAELDLLEAIRQRKDDQRRVRTFGLINFIDYFPHRELGIIRYKQGQIEASIHELAISVSMVKTAKAEFYLDQARKSLIEKDNTDQHHPEIYIKSPEQSFLTNAFSVVIQGVAKDDTFVRYIRVGGKRGKKVRVDVSSQEISFREKVPVVPGENRIPILASDLTAKTFQTFVTVNVDRIGPVISINDPFEHGTVSEKGLALNGYAFDNSGLAEMVINGEKFTLDGSQLHPIEKLVYLQPGQKELLVEVRDRAGNVTSARLAPSAGANKAQQPDLLAENITYPAMILSDREATGFLLASGTWPRIELIGLKDRQITYHDKAVITGRVSADRGVDSLFVDGKEFFKAPRGKNCTKAFFKDWIQLRKGENLISFRCIDISGKSGNKTIMIIRKIPKIREIESRLKVVVYEFRRNNRKLNLSHEFETHLCKNMGETRPFNSICLKKKSVDEDKERKKGKEQGFDCVLFGSVNEDENERSVEIVARLKDTDTDIMKELAVVDVYDQDVDIFKLKRLVSEMDMKLADELPVIEGMVINARDNWIDVDIGEDTRVKKNMKLIVYESGNGKPVDHDYEVLGQARIKEVKKEKSIALLYEKTGKKAIQPMKHRVITR